MATCDVSVHSWRFKLRVQIIVALSYYNCDAYFTFLSIKTDKIKHHFNKKMWCLEKDLLCVLLTGKMQVWWPFHMKGIDKKGCCIKIFGTILLILIILITFSSAIKCDASW